VNENPDPRTRSPRYVRVYTALREWIDTGKYAPGDKISSEEEIGQMFGVSRITTRKAIDLLVDDDLVFRMHGKGTYVSENVRQRVGIDNIKKRMRSARRRAIHNKIKKAEVSVIMADPRTSLDLKLPPESKVLRASYIRTFSGQPVGYMEAFIPVKLGLKIKSSDLATSTPLKLLEKSGVKISGANQLIGATLADSHLASLLNVLVGSPLLRIKHVVFDSAEKPVERFIAYYRADQYEHPMILDKGADLDLVHGVASSRR
jgi:GntR family transcriptional regulator